MRKAIWFFYRSHENRRRDIPSITLMAIYNENNETRPFPPLNQSSGSANFFQVIYHFIKDVIEAGQHDISMINGKVNMLYKSHFFMPKKKEKKSNRSSILRLSHSSVQNQQEERCIEEKSLH